MSPNLRYDQIFEKLINESVNGVSHAADFESGKNEFLPKVLVHTCFRSWTSLIWCQFLVKLCLLFANSKTCPRPKQVWTCNFHKKKCFGVKSVSTDVTFCVKRIFCQKTQKWNIRTKKNWEIRFWQKEENGQKTHFKGPKNVFWSVNQSEAWKNLLRKNEEKRSKGCPEEISKWSLYFYTLHPTPWRPQTEVLGLDL